MCVMGTFLFFSIKTKKVPIQAMIGEIQGLSEVQEPCTNTHFPPLSAECSIHIILLILKGIINYYILRGVQFIRATSNYCLYKYELKI